MRNKLNTELEQQLDHW